MFESLKNIFKKNKRKEIPKSSSKDAAKERLHLVLMQDRANVSADFLDLMRGEIIEVIKKYIDIDEEAMDVRLTTETNEDGVQGAPALYANIPIINIKDETRKMAKVEENKEKEEPPKIEKKESENEVKDDQEQENEEIEAVEENFEAEEEIEEDNEENEEKSEENIESTKEEEPKVSINEIAKEKIEIQKSQVAFSTGAREAKGDKI